MKHKGTLTALSLALGLSAVGVGAAYAAQTTTTTIDDPMHNLVQAIADKFNLDETAVQEVFDEQHAQMEAEHQQRMTEHLQQAVTDGEITQAQMDLIVAKQEELQNNKPDLSDLTEAERQETMKTHMAEIEQWAEDNDIPKEYLPFGPGPMGKHDGPGRFIERLDDNTASK